MKRRMTALALALLMAASLAPRMAAAQELGAGRALIRSALAACGGDIARLCADVLPGGGRLAQCLTDNRAKLSPACGDEIDKGKTYRKAMFACTNDAERYCADVRPGGGRIVRCLGEHRADLSRDCHAALTEMRDMLTP